MSDHFPDWIKTYGAIFRFGSGLLGKTAIVVAILVGGILGVAWSLRSDELKMIAIGIAAVSVFLWFGPLLFFCHLHPEATLLEGGEYVEHHRNQISALGHRPGSGDTKLIPAPGTTEEKLPAHMQIDGGPK
jgi:hypothetical protein